MDSFGTNILTKMNTPDAESGKATIAIFWFSRFEQVVVLGIVAVPDGFFSVCLAGRTQEPRVMGSHS